MTCPDCQGTNTGSGPTGDWCNVCGWASPGYSCDHCGRQSVNRAHHLPDLSAPCPNSTTRSAPVWRDGNWRLLDDAGAP